MTTFVNSIWMQTGKLWWMKNIQLSLFFSFSDKIFETWKKKQTHNYFPQNLSWYNTWIKIPKGKVAEKRMKIFHKDLLILT